MKKEELQIGESYRLSDMTVELVDFIDEITCDVIGDQQTCGTRPQATWQNKVCRFFGWPLSMELYKYTYKAHFKCSVWSLKPLTPTIV
jgi:hypothetical protein